MLDSLVFSEYLQSNGVELGGNFKDKSIVYRFPDGSTRTKKEIEQSNEYLGYSHGIQEKKAIYARPKEEPTREKTESLTKIQLKRLQERYIYLLEYALGDLRRRQITSFVYSPS